MDLMSTEDEGHSHPFHIKDTSFPFASFSRVAELCGQKMAESSFGFPLFPLINFNVSLIFPSPLSAAQRSQRSPH
jgi:hypothetical protein